MRGSGERPERLLCREKAEVTGEVGQLGLRNKTQNH